MALESYDDLKTEIASYVARSDTTAAAENIDTFIDLAEALFNKKLRVTKMHDDFPITTVPSESKVDLPADFLEVYTIEFTDSPRDIDYIPRSQFKKYAPENTRPKRCTLSWNKTDQLHQIEFSGTPDGAYGLDLIYFARLPALSSNNQTNWLLTDYPELYLNTCLYYAFKRFRSPLAADYKALAESDIELINSEDEKKQTGGGGMRIRINGTCP